MKRLVTALTLFASPALAATGPFFSLGNSDFVVLLAFTAFVGVLIYMKVPGKIAGLLDARAVQIKSDLAEAKALRDEAQALLASYEARQQEVAVQSERIVTQARDEAMQAARLAKEDLAKSIDRRLAAATDQIASAEAGAVAQVRQAAVSVAIAAARDVLARQMTAQGTSASIDAAISQVEAKLH